MIWEKKREKIFKLATIFMYHVIVVMIFGMSMEIYYSKIIVKFDYLKIEDHSYGY